MLRLSNFPVPLDYTEDSLRTLVLKRLHLSPDQLLCLSVFRRSVDARDKTDVHFVLSLNLSVKNEQALLKRNRQLTPVRENPLPPLPQQPRRRKSGTGLVKRTCPASPS